jgi:hypothetical protein
MAMAITMRMVARIFFIATEVTQGPLSSVHYTHIKHTPKSRCAICKGFEDATKMRAHSRGICLADLAADQLHSSLSFSFSLSSLSLSLLLLLEPEPEPGDGDHAVIAPVGLRSTYLLITCIAIAMHLKMTLKSTHYT